jgi:Tol biopolymer transport system component
MERPRFLTARAIAGALAISAPLAVTTIAPATSSRSSLVQVEVREVRPALVRIGGSHAWSPDGRRIAFGQNQNGSAQLVLTNAAGDQPQVIWQSQEKPWARIAPRYLSFSPDGHLFGVDGGYMLAIVDEGGRIVRQSNGVNDHVWAPDGQHLVVDGSEAGTALAVLSLNGRRRELTRGVDIPGSWSSDGRWIAFTRDRATEGGMPDPGPYDVYVIRSSGGKPQRFARDAEKPVLSPDGKRIVLWRTLRHRFEIWTVRSNGTPGALIKRLGARGPEPVRWSASGQRLFVLGKRSAAARTLNRFSPTSEVFGPAFSPDGKRILFGASARRCGVWLLTVASNTLKRVARGSC